MSVIELTRRGLIGAGAAALAAPAIARMDGPTDVVVVGAGVFGAWTAVQLQRMGKRVTLVDQAGPANARASSGGESRMIRAGYGADAIYTRMARDSLPEWKALSDSAPIPIFHPTGVLFLFQKMEPYAADSMRVCEELGVPTPMLEPAEIARRHPGIALDGIAFGLSEPGFGVLMARRAVQLLVARFVRAGGTYLQAQVMRPEGPRLDRIETSAGPVAGAAFVFALGPWLPKLFPDLLARRITPTRQEVFFFAPPPGDRRFAPPLMPGWADWNGGDIWYGMPDLEARGFKIAFDGHGPVVDPDVGDRLPSPAALENARAYVARRFPALAASPINEVRICQYENSSNGDFLIDRHPAWPNAVLMGGGSGHGFKHGPEVGRYAAALVAGTLAQPEPRFSLASKAEVRVRAVH
jgi:glycine/D-amino acid oxidase-like deaminating enzyme